MEITSIPARQALNNIKGACVDKHGLRPSHLQEAQRIERLFRRLKGFRKIFSRFEKLDVLFFDFLNFAPS